jgi:hypothetical protein
MIERRVPNVSYEQVAASAKKPKDVPQERWVAGMAVVETLFVLGFPTSVVNDSVDGPDIPNKYYITGTGVTVEHMPHWAYATVDNGEQRTHVGFTTAEKVEDEGSQQEVIKTATLPVETIITNLKETIVKSWL